ncbi:MAG: agmatine deiminase family protein [Gemmatimonadetes bacterium]|nr:agmatine deiminase family protein [Gemmatimonadota bacterium]
MTPPKNDDIRKRVRWPAEWEPHEATWIAWPHHEPDWPEKFETIPWVYAEIVRVLAAFERVNIVCHSAAVRSAAARLLEAHAVKQRNVRLHLCPTDRVWLRDTAPTGIRNANGRVEWVDWGFNGWSKYPNYARDAKVGAFIARASKRARRVPVRPESKDPVILEGGGIETDGIGTVMVTEEWLLSRTQVRNRGLRREDYEQLFARELGARHTIWLGEGCVGDDTHGHVDDIARFVAPGVVLAAHERDPADANHHRSADNLRRLRSAVDSRGRPLTVVTLPYPRAVSMNGERLPASYANFYIANGVVLVPTFNDSADRAALETIARVFRRRKVVGIHAVDLVWGLGTLHCLTQQQPATAR